jgi:ketosteroid isomerase-like protein
MTEALSLTEALSRMVAAVNAADARAYAAVYARDAVIVIYGGGRLEGRDAIERYEVELLRSYPGTRFALSDIWVSGDSAVVRYGVNTPAGGGPATGHEGLLFYRFDETGEIAEERRYLDALTPMAQAGALGPGAVRSIPTLPSEPRVTVATSERRGTSIEAATAILAALDARDSAAVLALLTDDVAIDDLILPSNFNGKAGARGWMGAWTIAAPDAKTETISTTVAGDVAIVETILRGTLAGPLGWLSGSNRPFALHRALVLTFEGDRIARIAAFANGRELAEETGQWPPPAVARP